MVFVYTTVDNVDRAAGRREDRRLLHRRDPRRLARLPAVAARSSCAPPTSRLDATAELFLRDCARRTIRLIANEPDARDREEYDDKLRQIRADHDLPDDTDVIFVEVTVTDPSDFERTLDVHGEVMHGTTGCSRVESSSVPERPGRAAAARA